MSYATSYLALSSVLAAIEEPGRRLGPLVARKEEVVPRRLRRVRAEDNVLLCRHKVLADLVLEPETAHNVVIDPEPDREFVFRPLFHNEWRRLEVREATCRVASVANLLPTVFKDHLSSNVSSHQDGQTACEP